MLIEIGIPLSIQADRPECFTASALKKEFHITSFQIPCGGGEDTMWRRRSLLDTLAAVCFTPSPSSNPPARTSVSTHRAHYIPYYTIPPVCITHKYLPMNTQTHPPESRSMQEQPNSASPNSRKQAITNSIIAAVSCLRFAFFMRSSERGRVE